MNTSTYTAGVSNHYGNVEVDSQDVNCCFLNFIMYKTKL